MDLDLVSPLQFTDERPYPIAIQAGENLLQFGQRRPHAALTLDMTQKKRLVRFAIQPKFPGVLPPLPEKPIEALRKQMSGAAAPSHALEDALIHEAVDAGDGVRREGLFAVDQIDDEEILRGGEVGKRLARTGPSASSPLLVFREDVSDYPFCHGLLRGEV